MGRPDWAPDDVDIDKPSVARMYDHWLGGAHNFTVDREMSQQILSLMPEVKLSALANRAFLFRAVRYMVDQGVRQFLDIGSGIPTVGNVHEVAQRAAPESRVVYADIDDVAVEHGRHLLAGNPRVSVIQQDLRQPDTIVEHVRTHCMLDLGQPVGLLMVAVLHYVPWEDDPYAVVGRLRQALCPGSFVAISHGTSDEQPDRAREVQQMYHRTATPATGRTRAEVEQLFTGLQLVEPGLVWAPQWRPDDGDPADRTHPEQSMSYVGVGRVP